MFDSNIRLGLALCHAQLVIVPRDPELHGPMSAYQQSTQFGLCSAGKFLYHNDVIRELPATSPDPDRFVIKNLSPAMAYVPQSGPYQNMGPIDDTLPDFRFIPVANVKRRGKIPQNTLAVAVKNACVKGTAPSGGDQGKKRSVPFLHNVDSPPYAPSETRGMCSSDPASEPVRKKPTPTENTATHAENTISASDDRATGDSSPSDDRTDETTDGTGRGDEGNPDDSPDAQTDRARQRGSFQRFARRATSESRDSDRGDTTRTGAGPSERSAPMAVRTYRAHLAAPTDPLMKLSAIDKHRPALGQVIADRWPNFATFRTDLCKILTTGIATERSTTLRFVDAAQIDSRNRSIRNLDNVLMHQYEFPEDIDLLSQDDSMINEATLVYRLILFIENAERTLPLTAEVIDHALSHINTYVRGLVTAATDSSSSRPSTS